MTHDCYNEAKEDETMHPYEYDDEREEPSSFGEYGRQAWDDLLHEGDENNDGDDQIHLSKKAERDLLEFANDRLRNRETAPVVKVWIFLILSFAMLMLAIGYISDTRPADPGRRGPGQHRFSVFLFSYAQRSDLHLRKSDV